jgi:hypothetical protein
VGIQVYTFFIQLYFSKSNWILDSTGLHDFLNYEEYRQKISSQETWLAFSFESFIFIDLPMLKHFCIFAALNNNGLHQENSNVTGKICFKTSPVRKTVGETAFQVNKN